MVLLRKGVRDFRSRIDGRQYVISRFENTDCIVWFESGDRSYTRAGIVDLLGYEPNFSDPPPISRVLLP